MTKRPYLVLAVVAACGGGGHFDEVASNVEGIYMVGTYTRNEAACTEGGTSALKTETFAVATKESFAGVTYLSVTSCESVADCHAKLDAIRAGTGAASDFHFAVDGTSGDTLTGAGAFTGFNMNGTCTMGSLTATRLTLSDTTLRIEKQITLASDYPAADGFCTTDLAKKNAEGKPCSQMEVLVATLVEAL